MFILFFSSKEKNEGLKQSEQKEEPHSVSYARLWTSVSTIDFTPGIFS